MPTVSVSIVREITLALRPPRAVFLPWPLGHPLGRPGDRAQQRAVLLDMLEVLETAREAGALIDLDHPWTRG